MRKLIPAALLLILFGVLYWYASSNHFFIDTDKEAQAAPVLVKAAADQVDAIELDIAGKPLKLVKGKEDWKVHGNDTYPLSSYAVSDWVTTFTGIAAQSVVEEEAADMAKYGLDHPVAVYSIREGGNVRRIEIGGNTPVPGTVYARADQGKTVYQVSESDLSGLKRSAFDFAWKEPLTFALEEVQRFEWSWEGKTYNLTKGPTEGNSAEGAGNWSLNGNRVTQEKATSLINAFRFLNIDREPKRANTLSEFGTKQAWSLTITLQPEAIDLEQPKKKAMTKRYGGYLQEEQMWIISEDGTWANPVNRAAFDEAIQTWQDDSLQDESQFNKK